MTVKMFAQDDTHTHTHVHTERDKEREREKADKVREPWTTMNRKKEYESNV